MLSVCVRVCVSHPSHIFTHSLSRSQPQTHTLPPKHLLVTSPQLRQTTSWMFPCRFRTCVDPAFSSKRGAVAKPRRAQGQFPGPKESARENGSTARSTGHNTATACLIDAFPPHTFKHVRAGEARRRSALSHAQPFPSVPSLQWLYGRRLALLCSAEDSLHTAHGTKITS